MAGVQSAQRLCRRSGVSPSFPIPIGWGGATGVCGQPQEGPRGRSPCAGGLGGVPPVISHLFPAEQRGAMPSRMYMQPFGVCNRQWRL
jgi:hypothetical protein